MNPTNHPISVVLVEDHKMFREWLGHMIGAAGDFTVVGETDNIGDALVMIEKLRPDIAIVDLTLRGSSGLELIKNLKAQNLDIPILVLSMPTMNSTQNGFSGRELVAMSARTKPRPRSPPPSEECSAERSILMNGSLQRC